MLTTAWDSYKAPPEVALELVKRENSAATAPRLA